MAVGPEKAHQLLVELLNSVSVKRSSMDSMSVDPTAAHYILRTVTQKGKAARIDIRMVDPIAPIAKKRAAPVKKKSKKAPKKFKRKVRERSFLETLKRL